MQQPSVRYPQTLGPNQPYIFYEQPKRYTTRDYPALAKFSGEFAEERPSWLAYYTGTTQNYSIPLHENFERIKKALVADSPAFRAVQSMLQCPTQGPQIIAKLATYFGQPRLIVQALEAKARKFPEIMDVSQIDRLVALATEVDNLVTTLVSLPEHAHMVEGALLKIMI